MSKLHERLLKHKHMTLEEKKNCTCELCKGLNIHKTHRVEMNMRKLNIQEQKSDVSDQKTEISIQNIELVKKDITENII